MRFLILDFQKGKVDKKSGTCKLTVKTLCSHYLFLKQKLFTKLFFIENEILLFEALNDVIVFTLYIYIYKK